MTMCIAYFIENENAVTEMFGLIQIMCGKYDSTTLTQHRYQFPHIATRLCVNAATRFIEYNQIW